MTPISSQRYLSYFLHLVVAYFFIALVIVPKAYGAGVVLAAVGLLLFIFFAFKAREKCSLDSSCYAFVAAFCFYFFIYLLDVLIHQDSTKILDGPSRALTFLFVFYLFKNYPIKLQLLLYVIPLGGIISGLLSFYQVNILHYNRAFQFSYQMPIQFGDISMSLGMFCAAIFFYSWNKKLNFLSILCVTGIIGGVIGSLFSLSRGGWLLSPFILLILLYLNRTIFSKKAIIGCILTFLVAFSLIISMNTPIKSRIEIVYQQITNILSNRQLSNLPNDGSVSPRLELWKAGLLAIQEKPLFGWGDKGADTKRAQQAKQGIISEHDGQYGHSHNQFLNDTLERGVIGLLSLLAVFLFPLWQFFKAYRENKDNLEVRLLATLGMIHITSVMSYGLTQVFFAHNSGNMFYFFLTVLFYAMLLEYKKQTMHLNK
ncbi:O-antigen ligase [Gallibacterium anatis]|uniref:O-antigen ligase family protein n=1 Tax=Gallibacterium anatis TaxID=750 RepID=UPI0025512BF0|nr:O-antigen ligase [Gallibacterium anatis]WIM81023.1 O-antigen ligase [Gallibacterium anatis]WIM85545.1 O-antigen ligase [Gallibacterium anatis]